MVTRIFVAFTASSFTSTWPEKLDSVPLATSFHAQPVNTSMVYAAFEHFDKKPPLSYSLIARKTL